MGAVADANDFRLEAGMGCEKPRIHLLADPCQFDSPQGTVTDNKMHARASFRRLASPA